MSDRAAVIEAMAQLHIAQYEVEESEERIAHGYAVAWATEALDTALAAGCVLPDMLERVGNLWYQASTGQTAFLWDGQESAVSDRDGLTPVWRIIRGATDA